MMKNSKFPFASVRFGKLLFFAAIGMSFFLLPFATQWKNSAAGTYSGRVFKDFNGNGVYNTAGDTTNPAVDVGVSGVTATLYDSTNTARGTANTAADGTFSIVSSGTGPYRVEFTNLPSGFLPSARSTDSVSGGTTTNAGSTVQFVPNSGTTNINLALNVPDDYCQNNPLVCNAMYLVGNVDGAALHTFPYSYSNELDGNISGVWTTAPSRDATLAPSSIGTNVNLGATYGLAWDKFNSRLFASAYVKRGARQGSLSSESTGAIYVKSNPSSASPSPTLYVDLNLIFGGGTTGANPHPVATTDWTSAESDPGTTQYVAKRGLGDLEISANGANLYTVNLADRRVYVIPTSGTLNSTTITRFDVPTTGLATSSGNCNAADVRPFGLGRNASGQIFVGAVCSAESESNDTKLHLYVWRFDNPGFTLVLNRSLSNFTRYIGDSQSTASWERWSNTVTVISKPSPMLADINFDGDAMVLGIRDRYGDQVVFPDYFRGYGDIMRACLVSGSYTFESNASCGGTTTSGISINYEDTFTAVAYNGSTGTTSWTANPWAEIGEADGANAGENRVVATPSVSTNALRIRDNFGMSRNISLSGATAGGRLLFSYQRANAGLTVEYNDGSTWQALTAIATATDGSFQDYSAALPSNATAIRLNSPNESGGAKYVYVDNFSVVSLHGSNGEFYLDLNGDGREEGMLGSLLQVPGHTQVMTTAYDPVAFNSSGNRVSNFYTAGVQKYSNTTGSITGAYDAYLNADPDNFGKANGIGDIEALCDRAPIEVGNRVWNDVDSDGVQDAGEANYSGVTLQFWADTDSNGTVDTQVGTAVTDANGEYYFVSSTVADPNTTDNIGQINGGIISGRAYQVRIPASNFNTGQPLNNRLRTPNDNDGSANGDSRDSDGLASSGNVIANFVAGSAGNNDHTFDFGFYLAPTAAVVPIEGRVSASDGRGIRNVVVGITLQDGTVRTTRTGTFGYYRFDDIEVGQSVVISVRAKRFTFTQPTVILSVEDAVENLDFVAIE